MSSLTVALLQLRSPGPDPQRALREGERACREAAGLGADVALFPELWQVGYAPWPSDDAGREAWSALATDTDGPFVGRFRELARELGIAIVITYLQRWDGPPRNAATIIDRRGEIVLTYAKVHTCAFAPLEAALTPGNAFPVATLDTGAGSVAIGAMICFDREFPESARALMLGGAELILVPNACPMETHRLGQLRTRAWENLVGVALANYAAPQQNGHSVAFDPIAFDARGESRDTLVVEAGEAEGVYLAHFDLDALRACREREVWGNAFRHPDTYAALTATRPASPFVRVDPRGATFTP
jgi:predicted amidohydrolase